MHLKSSNRLDWKVWLLRRDPLDENVRQTFDFPFIISGTRARAVQCYIMVVNFDIVQSAKQLEEVGKGGYRSRFAAGIKQFHNSSLHYLQFAYKWYKTISRSFMGSPDSWFKVNKNS